MKYSIVLILTVVYLAGSNDASADIVDQKEVNPSSEEREWTNAIKEALKVERMKVWGVKAKWKESYGGVVSLFNGRNRLGKRERIVPFRKIVCSTKNVRVERVQFDSVEDAFHMSGHINVSSKFPTRARVLSVRGRWALYLKGNDIQDAKAAARLLSAAWKTSPESSGTPTLLATTMGRSVAVRTTASFWGPTRRVIQETVLDLRDAIALDESKEIEYDAESRSTSAFLKKGLQGDGDPISIFVQRNSFAYGSIGVGSTGSAPKQARLKVEAFHKALEGSEAAADSPSPGKTPGLKGRLAETQ